jgi:hypothetical protein
MLPHDPGLVEIILETVPNSDPKLINAKKLIQEINVKSTIQKFQAPQKVENFLIS